MNENPGGTPNPLNPNVGPVPTPEPLSANPAEPVQAPVQPSPAPVAPSPATEPNPVVAEAPAAEATENPLVAAAEAEAPTENPAGSVIQDKPKKKVGLIIGIIILIIALIGGGVAAAFMMGLFGGGDPVAAAIAKMTGENRPENVSLSGTITVMPDNASMGVSKVVIDLKSSAQTSSLINSTTATLTATMGENEIEVSLGEVYAANGDLYFNISGIDEAIDTLMNQTPVQLNDEEMPELPDGEMPDDDLMPTVDCIDETDCIEQQGESMIDLSGMAGIIASIFGAVDGEWIRIPTDSLSDFSSSFGVDSSTQCLIEAANNATKKGNSVAEIYSKHAFISGSNENVSVAKKNDPIYKIVFDEDKMKEFFEAVDTADIYDDSSCATEEVSTSEAVAAIKSLPTIYTEVNSENQFTRFYVSSSNNGSTIIVDLSIGYPTNISVSEPEEYIDFEDLLTGIFMSMFDYSDYEAIDFSEEL
ncbi:hypothetical protein IJJ49_00590 [Candidatus Saccharibacteria bacterium]|nr:hypothetical protein [Candidatus Saccharibacteria bacterium]